MSNPNLATPIAVSSSDAFSDFLNSQQLRVQIELTTWVSQRSEKIWESAAYSLLSPSKRLRPLFCLETAYALTGDYGRALPAALALEMIHSYSLVHDDLPAMDDDDLRRGKPTNHKVYGEAMAILAGDGLLTLAFEVLAKAGSASAETRVRWVRELSEAAGMNGMVLGQAIDMETTGILTSVEKLELLHRKKTGALLAASVTMGAIAAGASEAEVNVLRDFALDMGLAFQIRDDILDYIGGKEIGKPTMSDQKNAKTTYVSLLGLETAERQAGEWFQRSIKNLNTIQFPYKNRLEELTRFVVERKL